MFAIIVTLMMAALTVQYKVAASSSSVPVSSTKTTTCDAKNSVLLNSAFVFIKPHANTIATRQLVSQRLQQAGIDIISEMDIDGKTIDEKKLIDQHYYAIASKATILSIDQIPVPAEKFLQSFGESWETVVQENRACNAMEATKRFKCTAEELNAAWNRAHVVKFGGGFYCGLVSIDDKDSPGLYVFNAFFMSMRQKFVGVDDSIHCYEVQWDPSKLSWHSFRNQLVGPTDPASGPQGSIRRTILETYKELGLETEPNQSDNGIHASASPLEGLAEKVNWLERKPGNDAFGKALLEAGISQQTIEAWSVDPRVLLPPDGQVEGSIFDAVEDMDVQDCLAKLLLINSLNL